MQLSNYHSHCTFCDGRSTPEDFIKFAVAHGFRAYGFSSHSPLPFETFWNMSKDDMPEYLTEIERLKKKYSDRLEIYVGLEIDFLDKSYNASIPYFRNLPLDYRIGSIHFLPIAQQRYAFTVFVNLVSVPSTFFRSHSRLRKRIWCVSTVLSGNTRSLSTPTTTEISASWSPTISVPHGE